MINFYHLIDVIPFGMATLILLVGASVMSTKRPITILVLIATGLYMVAQSTWFSSFLSGNEWGRDLSNYIWFAFNTSTMGIFIWTLLLNSKK
jgi:hypothetical protein